MTSICNFFSSQSPKTTKVFCASRISPDEPGAFLKMVDTTPDRCIGRECSKAIRVDLSGQCNDDVQTSNKTKTLYTI